METRPFPARLARLIAIGGLALVAQGMLFLCVGLSFLALEGRGRPEVTAGAYTWVVVSLGAGAVAIWHGLASLQKRPSRPLFLPAVWALVGIFLFCVLILALPAAASGYASEPARIPFLLAAAGLPSLWSVAWFARRDPGTISWRRATLALAGGALVGVCIAILLETAAAAGVLALVAALGRIVLQGFEPLLDALAGRRVADALASPSFVFVLADIALVAPIVEELVKPLVTLPLVRQLDRRDAFLTGALAGAGFAALENLIYAVVGLRLAAGLLLLRAIGGAVHPLGSGLVALGWHGVLRGKQGAGRAWLLNFGAAAGLHSLWNGGSLLVITLAGASFFGPSPPEIAFLNVSAAAILLAVLVVIGLGALVLGRLVSVRDQAEPGPTLSITDRTVAIWAVACVVLLVPAGIAALELLPR